MAGENNVSTETFQAIERQIKGFGENITALGNDTKRDLTEMRSLIDESGKKADVLIEDKITKLAASVETKQGAIESGLAEIRADVDKVATAMNRSGGAGWADSDAAKEAQEAFAFAKAKLAKEGKLAVGAKIEPDAAGIKGWNENFGLYMRRGSEQGPHVLTAAFQAALQVGSDPDGGYLVPTETSKRIIERIYETSPMRQVATIESISSKELELVRDDDEADCGWVGETEARPETGTPQLGVVKIPAHEMYAAPRVTQVMLEDSGINIEGWLARKVGGKFGRTEVSAFYTGTGVNQPKGLLMYDSGTAANQIEQIASGAAADFTFDGLKNLVFALEDGYEGNASFQINRLGVRNISKLKDGEGRYIWEMSTKVGDPSTLLGYAVRRATDITAPAANALAAAFGDFREGYTIVDRLGISTLRDPFSAKPNVIFYSRRRVGGAVVNGRAIKLQKLSVS